MKVIERIKKAMFMINVQKEIRRIMLEEEDKDVKLRELAQEMGCSLDSTYTGTGKHLREELIRRIQEAGRSFREARLWLIALISAIAAAVSAVAAWSAVLLAH